MKYNRKPDSLLTTAELVDELGALIAEKNDLLKREKDLKAKLADHGAGGYDGDLYRATVAITKGTTVNWKAIAQKLKPSRQLVQAHSKPSVTTRVTVKSRLSTKAA